MDSSDPMSVLHTTLKQSGKPVTVFMTDNSTISGQLMATDDHCNIVLRMPQGNCRFIRGALVRVIHS